MSTSTQAKIKFSIPKINQNATQYVYMGVYSSDNTLVSSNYYNNDNTSNSSRGSGIYLTVEEGCYIITIYYYIPNNTSSSTGSFYLTNLMTVSNISTLPSQNTLINLSINTSNKLSSTDSILDLSTDVTNDGLKMGVYKNVVNKYVNLISGTNTTTLGSDCINKKFVVFGDAAKTEVGAINGVFYSMHNICIDPTLLTKIYNMYHPGSKTTDPTDSTSPSTLWVWIMLFIFIMVIVILFTIGGFLWYRKKHKKI